MVESDFSVAKKYEKEFEYGNPPLCISGVVYCRYRRHLCRPLESSVCVSGTFRIFNSVFISSRSFSPVYSTTERCSALGTDIFVSADHYSILCRPLLWKKALTRVSRQRSCTIVEGKGGTTPRYATAEGVENRSEEFYMAETFNFRLCRNPISCVGETCVPRLPTSVAGGECRQDPPREHDRTGRQNRRP